MGQPKLHLISKKKIKPSSPTPENLKSYKLSFIDQSITKKYLAITLFYTNTNDQISISLLEKSLSNLLTFYYPFAGTLQDNILINCNDQGALFIESKIEYSMSEILEQPFSNVESTLYPYILPWTDPSEENGLCAVQITHFSCGGLSLSLCLTHKICDAKVLSNFLVDWADLARESRIPCPQLNSASFFIPNNDPFTEEYLEVKTSTFSSPVVIATKRFKFDASNVNRLKKIIRSETEIKDPTRTEVITAFFNACIGRYQNFPCIVYLAMNFRKLVNPNLENLMGNAMSFFFIHVSNEDELKLSSLVRKIRDEKVKKFKKYEGMNENEIFGEILEEKIKFPVHFDMRFNTSLCMYPFNEIDFGWGKPGRVSFGAIPSRNSVVLMDSMEEGGVDVIATLDETVMVKVQNDKELLEFAYLDPSF